LTQRTQELEQSYEARLQMIQTTSADSPASAVDSSFDLDTAIAAANAASLASIDDLTFEDASTPAASEYKIDLPPDNDGNLDLEALLNAPDAGTLNDLSLEDLDDISDLS
ncbi:MAG: hypothetical protein WBG38_07165, partial [Nodosilinea sp.]